MTKHISFVWLVGLIVLNCGLVQAQTEVGYTFETLETAEGSRLTFEYDMPQQDDFWDGGYMGELQIRRWSEHVGIAICLGYGDWDVTPESVALIASHKVQGPCVADANIAIDEINDARTEAASGSEGDGPSLLGSARSVNIQNIQVSGNANPLQGGVSFLYRPWTDKNVSLSFEAGIRYIFISSKVNVDVSYTEPRSGVAGIVKGDTELDEAVVGRLGADLEIALTPEMSLFAGAGYQFDIEKSRLDWEGRELFEVEMGGPFARAGLQFNF